MKILRVDIKKLNCQILALVLNQSPISAIPPIERRFSLDPKIAISKDPLYCTGRGKIDALYITLTIAK